MNTEDKLAAHHAPPDRQAAIQRFLASHGNKRTARRQAVSISMQAVETSRRFMDLIRDFLSEKNEDRKQMLMAKITSNSDRGF